jgi:hypothetical protein
MKSTKINIGNYVYFNDPIIGDINAGTVIAFQGKGTIIEVKIAEGHIAIFNTSKVLAVDYD